MKRYLTWSLEFRVDARVIALFYGVGKKEGPGWLKAAERGLRTRRGHQRGGGADSGGLILLDLCYVRHATCAAAGAITGNAMGDINVNADTASAVAHSVLIVQLDSWIIRFLNTGEYLLPAPYFWGFSGSPGLSQSTKDRDSDEGTAVSDLSLKQCKRLEKLEERASLSVRRNKCLHYFWDDYGRLPVGRASSVPGLHVADIRPPIRLT